MRDKKSRHHRRLPLPRRSWDALSPALQETRIRALTAVAKMRQGLTLSAAAKEVGIGPSTVEKHAGKVLVKRVDGRYRAKPADKISRGLVIYTRGKQVQVTVPDSRTASTIGQYFNAVRQYLNTRDPGPLRKFKNTTIIDDRGKKYPLETRPKKVVEIESSKEDREFFEIYKTGGSS